MRNLYIKDKNFYRNRLLIYYSGKNLKEISGGCFSITCSSKVTYSKTIDNNLLPFDFIVAKNSALIESDVVYPFICLLSLKEMESYLRDINLVLDEPISWKFIDLEEDILKLSLYVPKCYNKKQLLYILTRVRQLFEIPYCFLIRDAIKLYEISPEKYDSIEQCLYIVMSFFSLHSTSDFRNFLLMSERIINSGRCSLLIYRLKQRLVWKGIDKYKERFKNINTFSSFQYALYEDDYEDCLNKQSFPKNYDLLLSLGFWAYCADIRVKYYNGEISEQEILGNSFEFPEIIYNKDPNIFLNKFNAVLNREINRIDE